MRPRLRRRPPPQLRLRPPPTNAPLESELSNPGFLVEAGVLLIRARNPALLSPDWRLFGFERNFELLQHLKDVLQQTAVVLLDDDVIRLLFQRKEVGEILLQLERKECA